MKLEEYLDRYQTPVAALARRAGVCPTTIRYVLYGKDIRLSVAKVIVDATNGEVTLEDLAARKNHRQDVIPKEDKRKTRARAKSRFVKSAPTA